MNTRRTLIAGLLVALAVLASHTNAMVVFSSIDDVDGLYNPSVSGDGTTLEVNPIGFDVLTKGAGSDSTTGTLNVTITAEAGYQITGICFLETGDYTVDGSGQASAELTYTAMLNGGPSMVSGSSTTNAAAGSATWSNDFDVNFPVVTTSVDLSIVNVLTATGVAPVDLAFIKKKASTGIMVKVAPIPEPASGLMLLLGIVGVARFRRKAA